VLLLAKWRQASIGQWPTAILFCSYRVALPKGDDTFGQTVRGIS
jgi:hypothetical protein